MSLNSPVRQTPLVAQVAQQFRELVEQGAWPVGEKIPGEHRLADELGVSRGTVREALRALSLTGLLEPRVGDGTYVRARDEIAGLLAREQPSTTLEHVLDARAGLESAAARLAAGHLTPAHREAVLDALRRRAAAHEEGDLDGYVTADLAFHRSVVSASENPVLLRLWDAIFGLLAESVRETATLPEDVRVRRAHEDLFDAIDGGDVTGAADLADALIASVKQSLPAQGPAVEQS